MKLLSPIDVTVLTWLKPELDSTLHQARKCLELFVEDGNGVASLRDCSQHLHQVAGILNMVELTGAARLAEEMEQLASRLAEENEQANENVFSLLMQCIVQLPDYLERLQNGHRDVPIVLLPLINELRSLGNHSPLSEEAVYTASTQLIIPDAVVATFPLIQEKMSFSELALQFQAHLPVWLNGQDGLSGADQLASICGSIIPYCQEDASKKLFWVASCLFNAVALGKIESTKQLRQSLVKIDQEVNYLNNKNMGEVRHSSPVRLSHQLLYFIAQSPDATERLRQVYDAFDLAQNIPDEEEVRHAKSSLLGRNNALLQSVSAVIKEDILRVKDALDMTTRKSDQDIEKITELVDILSRIESTLGLIDANEAKQIIKKNKELIQDFASNSDSLSEANIMEIAKSLLSVEQMLDHKAADVAGSKQAKLANEFLTSAQSNQLLDALIRESIVNFTLARQAYVAFVEGYWEHAELEVIPTLLKQISGALSILEFTPVSNYIDAISAFTSVELIDRTKVPSGVEMERLAEVLASLEYYLESVRDRRPNRERILDITEASLIALHYWPIPDYALQLISKKQIENSAAVFHDANTFAGANTSGLVDKILPEPEKVQDKPTTKIDQVDIPSIVDKTIETVDAVDNSAIDATVALEGFDLNADGIDDEIREIFLEEFSEESGNLHEFLEQWKEEPESEDLIRPIRRVFHTLKGSGRLVGASALSDFSWKIESLLNRVLDGTRPASEPVVSMLSLCLEVLPKYQQALLGQKVYLDTIGLCDTADRLAAGEEIYYSAKQTSRKIDNLPSSSEALSIIDPVLLEILTSEITGHLVTVNAWLEKAAAHEDSLFEDSIFRSVHTMNGAFAMTEVSSISGVLAPAESLVRRAIAHNVVAKTELLACLAQVLDAVQATLEDLRNNVRPNTYPDLEAWVTAQRDELPELPINGLVPIGIEQAAAEQAAAEQAAAEQAAAEQAAAEQAAAEQAAAEQAAAEQAAAEQAAAEQAAAEQAAAEQAAAEQAAAEQAAAEQAAAEQAAAEQAAAEQAAAEQAAAEQAAAEQAAAEQAAAEQAAAEQAAAEQAAAEQAAAEQAAAEQAAAEQAAAEQAAAEQAAAEQAAAEQAAAEQAAAEQAAAEQAAAEQAAAEQAAAEQAAAEQAAAEQAAAEQAAAEQAAAEQAAAEQAAAEQAAAEQAAAEQAAAEQAAAEQAAAEQAAAEQAAAEQAAAEQAAAEQAARNSDLDSYGMSLEELERLTDPSYKPSIESEVAETSSPVSALIGEIDVVALVDLDAIEDVVVSESDASSVVSVALNKIEHSHANKKGNKEQDDQMNSLDMSDLDEELLDIFTEEAKDLLDQSDSLLVELKATPDNFELLFGIQRNLHTIKGGARMAGLYSIGELSHSLESLLQPNAEQSVVLTAKQFSLVEKSLDALHQMSHSVEERKAPILSAELMQMLETGEVSHDQDIDKNQTADIDVSDKVVETLRTLKELSGPIKPVELDTDEGLRTPQEVVRIRADLLEQLVNFAGEVAIYRARLEQQLGLFKVNLVELDQTTSRLREQLRRLDIETEAQIAARNIREVDQGRQDFDPLELDRFTNQQQLSRSLAESSNDLVNLQATMDDLIRHHESLLLQQSRVSSELQDGLMRTRMLPFESLLPRLRRVLRQAALDANKQVQLKIEGSQGEMDRTVLDRMIAPLEHLLRNAVAHGIEAAKDRKKAGKSAVGNVVINIAHEGTEVVLSVRDDGSGLDTKQIQRKALERGLIKEGEQLSEQQILNLITQTGFSTADSITRLSGRGIGMDVVSNEIKNLNGNLSIQTTFKKGTEFIIRLPLNLAVTKAVFVKIGENQFAIPIASVDGVGRISRDELEQKMLLESPEFNYAGNIHKIYDLGTLLAFPTAKAAGSMQMPMLLSKSGQDRIAICVDQVLGSQEIVVKPVGPQITSVPGVYGASIMPDGGVVVILDLAPLVRHNAVRKETQFIETIDVNARSMPLVMVVDDSITMRKVTSRILERNNYAVVVARDGLEAIEKMAEQVPDLVLLDIEMPRMDGYEVAQNMKADSRLQNVPIMMITSRTGDKHRQRAFELGVERYLGKPYQELELMRQVNEIFKK